MSVSQAIVDAMAATNAVFTGEVVPTRDVSHLDRVYTRDARILPPGAPIIAGRDAIRSFWAAGIAAMDCTSATLETVHAEAAGDMVFEIGKAMLKLGSGQAAEVKYVVLWKQEDGAWKWHVDMWSANA
jgi:ketosteroid isomerase-like protein